MRAYTSQIDRCGSAYDTHSNTAIKTIVLSVRSLHIRSAHITYINAREIPAEQQVRGRQKCTKINERILIRWSAAVRVNTISSSSSSTVAAAVIAAAMCVPSQCFTDHVQLNVKQRMNRYSNSRALRSRLRCTSHFRRFDRRRRRRSRSDTQHNNNDSNKNKRTI